jgi:hypothetical protein
VVEVLVLAGPEEADCVELPLPQIFDLQNGYFIL